MSHYFFENKRIELELSSGSKTQWHNLLLQKKSLHNLNFYIGYSVVPLRNKLLHPIDFVTLQWSLQRFLIVENETKLVGKNVELSIYRQNTYLILHTIAKLFWKGRGQNFSSLSKLLQYLKWEKMLLNLTLVLKTSIFIPGFKKRMLEDIQIDIQQFWIFK